MDHFSQVPMSGDRLYLVILALPFFIYFNRKSSLCQTNIERGFVKFTFFKTKKPDRRSAG